MQTRIPAVMMRGGTSKGLYFLASDLPPDVVTRDKVLLAAMGSPDTRQIDGMGGADPLTSKVAIVSSSSMDGVDVDYLFAQVVIEEARVDTAPNCGNMLAGVGAFAIEQGIVKADDGETTLRIHMVNSGNLCDQTVQTPGRQVTYDGAARIDGAPGTAAPVMINFLDLAGSACGSLLPTGNVIDDVDGVTVTCAVPTAINPSARTSGSNRPATVMSSPKMSAILWRYCSAVRRRTVSGPPSVVPPSIAMSDGAAHPTTAQTAIAEMLIRFTF